jgi:isopentenyl-diphosphate delta-isomerase
MPPGERPVTGAQSYKDPFGAFVTLDPPLFCAAGHLGAGFVVSLAADRLVIQVASPTRATSDEQSLTVSLTTGQTYHFPKVVFQPAGAWAGLQDPSQRLFVALIRPQSPEQQQLTDLMTIVRKDQHIAICQTQDVEASDRYTGFSDLRLRPVSLPELAWSELDAGQTFLDAKFAAPLLITGMTGGLARGAVINHRLAAAAAHFGIPMGVGSQRVALENPEHASIFAVKKKVPNVFLIGNLGIAQLGGQNIAANLDACQRAIDMIEADAMAIHVNILQEVIQVEGNRDFRGLLERLAELAHRLPVPLLIKEVGGGMDPKTATTLAAFGIKAIDVGGKGGTSWSWIEGQRAASPVTKAVAQTFRDWGVPTALSVKSLRQAVPHLDLVATGGVRDGLTVGKAVGIGAQMCGVGLPLFRAALESEEAPYRVLETLIRELKTAMICCGARNLTALKSRLVLSNSFTAAMQAHGLDANAINEFPEEHQTKHLLKD